MNAEVMNGTVGVGDRVAYPVRFASSMDVRIGTVTEVVSYEYELKWWNDKIRESELYTCYQLRVAVEMSSNGPRFVPKKPVLLNTLDRVVKL